MGDRRTNVEIVADAVVTLIHHGVIDRSDINLALIRDLVGLNRAALRYAADRRQAAGYAAITPTTIDNQPPPGETRSYARRGRHAREVGGRTQLRCTGGLKDPAHWASEDDFASRADSPHRRLSKCRHHHKETQRSRRISKDAAAAFDEADIDILYDDAGRPVGIECRRCGSKVGCDCIPSEDDETAGGRR